MTPADIMRFTSTDLTLHIWLPGFSPVFQASTESFVLSCAPQQSVDATDPRLHSRASTRRIYHSTAKLNVTYIPEMDDYWKLEESPQNVSGLRDDLSAGDYTQVPKSATLRALSAEWMRMHWGMLHYDACTTDELKRFVSDRRIQVSIETSSEAQQKQKRAPGRRQLISALQQHGDGQTFDKFLQLPNELQGLVSEMYMDFASTLDTPAQPPLARTCRHLRQLVLPIFYSTQRFALSYHSGFRSRNANRTVGAVA